MYLTPAQAEALTDDEDELDALVELYEPELVEGDPYYERMTMLTRKIAQYTRDIRSKARRAPAMFVRGMNTAQIAEECDCSTPTVLKVLKSDEGRHLMALHHELMQMHEGPGLNQRRHMLWNIAKRNEKSNPRVAIAAIDTLNKQEGVYQPQQTAPQPPTVIVQQFTLPNHQQTPPPAEIVQEGAQAHTGDFQPITVTVENPVENPDP